MELLKQKFFLVARYFDVRFFARFMCLLLCFYFLNLFLIKIANPRSVYYNDYLAKNFHYVSWMRTSILETSNVLANAMGLDSYLENDKTIRVRNGRALLMARQCLGLEIIGFWIAFIMAHAVPLKRRLMWSFAGILAIWLINTVRVAVLLYARQHEWRLASIDQHDLFNYVSYALVALLIYLFYKRGSNEANIVNAAGT